MAIPRYIYILVAALLIPYLALYAQHLAKNLQWLPLGDDYPIHIYMALQARENPLLILTSQHQYPSLIHLIGLASADPLYLGRLYAVYGALLIALGILTYGLLLKEIAGPKARPYVLAALLVIGSVRTLAGIIDGQLAEKTVLLIEIPLSLWLWAKGRQIAAAALLAPALYINYLGAAYAAILAAAYFILGDRKTKLFIATGAAILAAATLHKAPQILSYAAQTATYTPIDPLHALAYGFYGPSFLILIPQAIYLTTRAKKAKPLAILALTLLAIAATPNPYWERALRATALLTPIAATTAAVETQKKTHVKAALAAYLLGPAIAGYMWAFGHTNGLFAPVERITPEKLWAYQQILQTLPPNAEVEVMWQLDLWLLPLAKAQRPDITVKDTICNWGNSQYYVYTPPDPGQWYEPCVKNAPQPPGKKVGEWGKTNLYKK